MNIRLVAMLVAVASLHGVAHADEGNGDFAPRLIAQTVPNLTRTVGRDAGDDLLRDARITVGYDIDERGRVSAAHVIGGEHATGRLNAAAVKIVSGWTYEPAKHEGRPIATHGMQAIVVINAND